MEHAIKLVHITCVVLSITGFCARGFLKFNKSNLLSRRWLRIAPHVVDALLLLSAGTLVFLLQLNLLQQPWLIAKIFALLCYIALGLVTLRFAKSQSAQIASFIAAILVFIYIASVAMTHQVMPWLAVNHT